MAENISRVAVREKLPARREPYWHQIAQGRYVGFRQLGSSAQGTWIARRYDGARYHHKALGDFGLVAEKERFDAARLAAEKWFKHLDRGGATESGTVRGACEAYVTHLTIEKSEASGKDVRGRFERLVYDDAIATIDLAKLAPRHLAEWKKRVLARGGARASFNRNATALRRALNLAHQRREVASNHAWAQELKPFKGADGRRTLYLDMGRRRLLIEKAPGELRPLLTALTLLPLRPGDPAQLRVEHLNTRERTLHVPAGKTGARTIPVGGEALEFLQGCAKGKLPAAWLISRADGSQWDRFAWRKAIHVAAKAANLPPAVCAYTLRHSTITDLVAAGLDLFTVSKLAGTSIAMIEKHYGHLQNERARDGLARLALSGGVSA